MELTKDLKSKYGIILIDSQARKSFIDAVESLERVAEPSADTSSLIGDWRLLCSCTSTDFPNNANVVDTNKIPFFNEGPIKDIKETFKESIEVEQRIKSGESSNSIDTIDHVIEYKPPNTLSSFLKNVPDALKDLDINPLKVSDSKVVLKHKAEIEGVVPVIKTKLSLQAIVVNVAGESQILDPSGEDVLGINIPFGELRAGSFDTTYMDDSIRISRSKTGPVDQIRVFVKKDVQAIGSILDDDDDELGDDDDDDELADDDTLDTVTTTDTKESSTAGNNIDDDDDDIIVEAPSDIEN